MSGERENHDDRGPERDACERAQQPAARPAPAPRLDPAGDSGGQREQDGRSREQIEGEYAGCRRDSGDGHVGGVQPPRDGCDHK